MIEDRTLVRQVTTMNPHTGALTHRMERAEIRIEFLGGEPKADDQWSEYDEWHFIPREPSGGN